MWAVTLAPFCVLFSWCLGESFLVMPYVSVSAGAERREGLFQGKMTLLHTTPFLLPFPGTSLVGLGIG